MLAILIIGTLMAYAGRLCWLAGVVEGIRRANQIVDETREEVTRIQCRACRGDVAKCKCARAWA